MWRDILTLFKGASLLEEAFGEAVLMLETSHGMFKDAVAALHQQGKAVDDLYARDRQINKYERSVRRKIVTHLSVTTKPDVNMGLVLTAVVVDIERIGDYTKNISELVEMMPGRIDFGEHEALYEELLGFTHQLFDHCTLAFSKQDVDSARKVIEIYQRVSAICDGTLANLVAEAQERESLPKNQVALVLLLRYLKRVAAHLKNVASTVINPYDRIGFRA